MDGVEGGTSEILVTYFSSFGCELQGCFQFVKIHRAINFTICAFSLSILYFHKKEKKLVKYMKGLEKIHLGPTPVYSIYSRHFMKACYHRHYPTESFRRSK